MRTYFSVNKLFSNNGEIGLVCCETQHDEIGIGAPNTMMRVGIVRRCVALLSDVVDDLVLSFARNTRVGQDHIQFLPAGFFIQPENILLRKLSSREKSSPFRDVESESFGETVHEFCTGRDTIRIEFFLFRIWRR